MRQCKWVRKRTYVKNEIWETDCKMPMLDNHSPRRQTASETNEAVKKCNELHSVYNCQAMLELNFKPGDWHIALTYNDDNVTDDRAVIKKRARQFVERLRRRCVKLGIELKYLTMDEVGVRSKRWHHHFVLPQEIPIQLIRDLWPYGIVRLLNCLYTSDQGFEGLARYYVDKTKGGRKDDDRLPRERRYRFSRSCIKPKVTYEPMYSKEWTDKPPKGMTEKPGSRQEFVMADGGYPCRRIKWIGGNADICRVIRQASAKRILRI